MQESWKQLLERQHGVFTVSQAAKHGRPPDLLRDMESKGLYRTVAPHTMYVAGALELSATARLWMAVLTLEGAVLSHTTAARLWDFRVPDSDEIHITVLRKKWSPRQGITVHTVTTPLDAADLAARSDLPVTGRERSLVEAFGVLDRADERQTLVAEAFRCKRTTQARLSRAILRMPQVRRRPELFRTVEMACGGSQSAGEMKLFDLMARWSLPTPIRQHLPKLPNGRRYVDCAVPTYRIDIEYDGRHHLTDAQRHDDQLRDEALRRQQWVTIRVSDRRLSDERRLVADIWANILEQAQRFGIEPPTPPRLLVG